MSLSPDRPETSAQPLQVPIDDDRRHRLEQRAGRFCWRPGQRKTIYLCAVLLTLCLAVFVSELRKAVADYGPGHQPPMADFFAIWSYARLAIQYPVGELYDPVLLHARQVALGMNPVASAPFPYPPSLILLIWPLGLLPFGFAYLLWIAITLGLFLWVVISLVSRLPICLVGVLIAPVSAVCMAAGQSGFLSAALLTAGIRLAGTRPALSGILFALLSYKPQLGLLVPVALVAAGCWGAFRVAVVTAAVVALAASLAFGWDIWQVWLQSLGAYAAAFARAEDLLRWSPTVTANLRLAGFSGDVARIGQAIAAVAAAAGVFVCFRRGGGKLAAAVLLAGTALATPHALLYDLPMVAVAMALFIQVRCATEAVFSSAETAILVMALLFPILMMWHGLNLPISAVPLALLFAMLVRRQYEACPVVPA